MNPALTIMANALRVGDHLIERMNEHDAPAVPHRCAFLAALSRVGPHAGHRRRVSVGLTVSDLDRSVEFYTKVLSFEKVVGA